MSNTFAGKCAQLDLLEKYAHFVSKQHGDIEFPQGWISLEKEIFEAFERSGDDSIRLQHIKAKDGKLDVYYEGGDNKLFLEIKRITYKSHFMCDHCGTPITPAENVHSCAQHLMKVEYLFEPKQIKFMKRRYAAIRKSFRLEEEYEAA
jgi:hypothetical protein